MITFFLFVLALTFTFFHTLVLKSWKKISEIFLMYLIFFNIGMMGLLSFYAHTMLAEFTAKQIGWLSGSPFQYEIAVANLAFGVLGILSLRFHGNFWLATVLGNCIFLLGAFVVHIYEYWMHADTAPLNFGIFIWFNDLILPLILLYLIIIYYRQHNLRNDQKQSEDNLRF